MSLKDKINVLLQRHNLKFEVAEKSFLDATLSDGTEIVIDGETMIEGARVQVKTEEGLVDAPDGNHELVDGTIITTQAGIITGIDTVGQEEAPATEDEELSSEKKKEPKAEEQKGDSKTKAEMQDEPEGEPTSDLTLEMVNDKVDQLFELVDTMAQAIGFSKENPDSIKEEHKKFKTQFEEVLKHTEALADVVEKISDEPKKVEPAQKFHGIPKREPKISLENIGNFGRNKKK